MAQINTVSLLTNVAGFLLNQKDIAFYDELSYVEGNQTAGALMINTNQLLFGAFSGKVKEIFAGGKAFSGDSVISDIGNAVTQMLTKTEILSISLNRTSQIMRHPLEDGTQIADHYIQNPMVCTAEIAMPSYLYDSVYKEMLDYYNKKKPIVVLTKLTTIRHMYLTSMPHTITPQTMDRPSVVITLEEALFPTNKQPTNAENGDTVNVGVKNGV